jgi:hypothetical protein
LFSQLAIIKFSHTARGDEKKIKNIDHINDDLIDLSSRNQIHEICDTEQQLTYTVTCIIISTSRNSIV